MIKNMAITTPTIGRIAIGEMRTDDQGRRLPKKLNHFRITTQFKKDGEWQPHPLQGELENAINPPGSSEARKALQSIPVRVMFNDPELSANARLEAYDRNRRLVCAGDGCSAKRVVNNKIQSVECVGTDLCEFGVENRCALMTRLTVLINHQSKTYPMDEHSGFILRSRGYNSYNALMAKLDRFAKLFKGRLLGVPMVLRLLGKSSKDSHGSIFFYVSLDLAQCTLESARLGAATAREYAEADLDQAAYEKLAKEQLNNGLFREEAETDELEDLLICFKDDLVEQEQDNTPTADNTPVIEAPDVGMDALRSLLRGSTATSAANGDRTADAPEQAAA